MSLHVVGPRDCFCVKMVAHPENFSVAPAEIRDSNISLYSIVRFTFTLSASQIYAIKKWCGFSKINVFHHFLPHGSHILLLFRLLKSSTYIDKNNPCFRWTKKTFPIRYFSHPSFNRVSSNCISHSNPANGCPHRFRSRSTTGSSMFAHDLGHVCRGRRINTSGHSDFGILSNLGASSSFTWVYADTVSAACPSQSGSLAMRSITFPAVIWDGDEPCSVKNAKAPESSFTMSPRSTTPPLFCFLFCFFVLGLTTRFRGDICPSM